MNSFLNPNPNFSDFSDSLYLRRRRTKRRTFPKTFRFSPGATKSSGLASTTKHYYYFYRYYPTLPYQNSSPRLPLSLSGSHLPPLTSPCCTLLPILSALPLRRLFPPASKIAAASSPPRRQLSRAPKISRPVFALSRFALALSSSARLDTTPCSLLSCSTRTSVSRVDLSCCCSLGKL